MRNVLMKDNTTEPSKHYTCLFEKKKNAIKHIFGAIGINYSL